MISTSLSASSPPERSPLEPALSHSIRVKKWRKDNAKWEGQRRAVQSLEKKQTQVPEVPDPKMFP